MAGGDIGNDKGKKKINIHVDMTPMVDVIILLLIFFFMTSQFKEPAGVEINLPKHRTGLPIPISNTLQIYVADDGDIKMKHGYNEETDVALADIKGEIAKRQLENDKLVTILEVSPEAKYSKMVDVLDEFKLASAETGNRKFSLKAGSQD